MQPDFRVFDVLARTPCYCPMLLAHSYGPVWEDRTWGKDEGVVRQTPCYYCLPSRHGH